MVRSSGRHVLLFYEGAAPIRLDWPKDCYCFTTVWRSLLAIGTLWSEPAGEANVL